MISRERLVCETMAVAKLESGECDLCDRATGERNDHGGGERAAR